MQILIVDDEQPARDELHFLLKDSFGFKEIKEAPNGFEALNLIRENKFDLIFLDIQMPGMSGLELANKLNKLRIFPFIVFLTAYNNFALEAFDIDASDYLLKPIEINRLEKTIFKIKNKQLNFSKRAAPLSIPDKKYPLKITVYQSGHYIPLSISKIIALASSDKYTLIYTEKNTYKYKKSLKEMEYLIDYYNFFKCHRCYIINLDYLEFIEPWFNSALHLKLYKIEETIPVSRSKLPALKAILNMD